MPKLNSSLSFATTFNEYAADEVLGEGGAGRVYGGRDTKGEDVAIKVLNPDRATSDKRRRFRNEIQFHQRNLHANIITVIDHGLWNHDGKSAPFYVMRRYDASLRDLMGTEIQNERKLAYFLQILAGVEAAHMKGVIHRDLKPENILYSKVSDTLAIADFGIARFQDEDLYTLVETKPGDRLANFQYAAPEQRVKGKKEEEIDQRADIYALGFMLNELFTGFPPHGTEFKLISSLSLEYGFLDSLVSKMLTQSPDGRPASILEIKRHIQKDRSELISLQKISKIDETVIKREEIDEPLALDPPRLVGVDWDKGTLTLILDRPVSRRWVQALQNMGSFSCVYNKPPAVFSFRENVAAVSMTDHDAQNAVTYFKQWLPQASATLKGMLEREAREEEARERENLRREREAEESRRRVLSQLKM